MHKNIQSETLQRRSLKKWGFNREAIFKISAYLNQKDYLSKKFGFQTIIKVEVVLFEPPPVRAPPNAVILTGSAHPMNKVKQAS